MGWWLHWPPKTAGHCHVAARYTGRNLGHPLQADTLAAMGGQALVHDASPQRPKCLPSHGGQDDHRWFYAVQDGHHGDCNHNGVAATTFASTFSFSFINWFFIIIYCFKHKKKFHYSSDVLRPHLKKILQLFTNMILLLMILPHNQTCPLLIMGIYLVFPHF